MILGLKGRNNSSCHGKMIAISIINYSITKRIFYVTWKRAKELFKLIIIEKILIIEE